MVWLNELTNFNGSLKMIDAVLHRASGTIANMSSMAAQRPLTRLVAYAATKAAIDNFTRRLAIELAKKYGPSLRVNAIAPGFFVGEQNRDFLLKPDGSYTPMGRFGEAEELMARLSGCAARRLDL